MKTKKLLFPLFFSAGLITVVIASAFIYESDAEEATYTEENTEIIEVAGDAYTFIELESPEFYLDFRNFLVEKEEISDAGSSVRKKFVHDPRLYAEGWHELAQPKFWKDVIALQPEYSIVNIAGERVQLETIKTRDYVHLNPAQRQAFKRNMLAEKELNGNTKLFVTEGRSEFYRIADAMRYIPGAIEVFLENNVDPWYAQTILLIESPGQHNARSTVGAYGPFQLMPYNARKYGLAVNRNRDERSDLDRSAYAAARLINEVAIPNARRILNNHNISYNETDLWFRLLVMHIYHAGAGNVGGAINQIKPKEGGMALIQQLWQTEHRGFKNQSQNYSQIALAANILLDELLREL